MKANAFPTYVDRCKHMLILGAAGRGKTTRAILPLCAEDISHAERGVIVLEPSGNVAPVVAMMAKDAGRPYYILDPTRDDCCQYNLLSGPEEDVVKDIVSAYLCSNFGLPQFLRDLDVQALSYAIKVVKRLELSSDSNGVCATFPLLLQLLLNSEDSGGQGVAMVNDFACISAATDSEAKENALIAVWFLSTYFSKQSEVYKNLARVRTWVYGLMTNLGKMVSSSTIGTEPPIDLENILMTGGVLCFTPVVGATRSNGVLFCRLFLRRLLSAMRRMASDYAKDGAEYSVYIDEAHNFLAEDTFDIFDVATSCHGAVHIAAQSLFAFSAFYNDKYAAKRFAADVLSKTSNVLLFPGISARDTSLLAAVGETPLCRFVKDGVMQDIAEAKLKPLSHGYMKKLQRLNYESVGRPAF